MSQKRAYASVYESRWDDGVRICGTMLYCARLLLPGGGGSRHRVLDSAALLVVPKGQDAPDAPTRPLLVRSTAERRNVPR